MNINTISEFLPDKKIKFGLAGSVYDSACIASIPGEANSNRPHFKDTYNWLLEQQHADGSWGGAVPYHHDRIISTLAALISLKKFAVSEKEFAAIEKGTQYLWKNSSKLSLKKHELVGFELLLPTLCNQAVEAGMPIQPDLNIYNALRREKLALIPEDKLYCSSATICHSLEFLGKDVEINKLANALSANGSLGNSPSATAYYYRHIKDKKALNYLEASLANTGGIAAPDAFPCDTFEYLWAVYHLHLAGIPAHKLIAPAERAALKNALDKGGVSFAINSFPVPDADDTAVAAVLLHGLGEEIDPELMKPYLAPEGYFRTYPYERGHSTGVNIHVLHLLLKMPETPENERNIRNIIEYLISTQTNENYWSDKWHISPYYVTAHIIKVAEMLPQHHYILIKEQVEKARNWIIETRQADGSWGFLGAGTAEETAFALLALCRTEKQPNEYEIAACEKGLKFLNELIATNDQRYTMLPPLWIAKCLILSPAVSYAVIEAGRMAAQKFINANRKYSFA